jgi:hypothetical protein
MRPSVFRGLEAADDTAERATNGQRGGEAGAKRACSTGARGHNETAHGDKATLPDGDVTTQTRQRHWRRAAIVVAVGVPVTLIGLLPSQHRYWLLAEYGPVQITAALSLLFAAICAWRLYRSQPTDSKERPTIAFVFFLMVFFFWHEAELDHELLAVLGFRGRRAFSWKYLIDGSPLWIKLVLGIPSLGLTAWIVRILAPNIGTALAQAWENRRAASPWYLLIGLGFLALAQMWDHAESIAAQTGWTFVVTGDREPAPEEMLEICGELVLLFCVLEFRQEVRGRAEPSRKACSPRRGSPWQSKPEEQPAYGGKTS